MTGKSGKGQDANAEDAPRRTVIVVGAGFAGLAAARQLSFGSSQRVEVTVLEGGDRLGGRAWTHTLPGLGKTEFGATYLHGTKGHHVYQLASEAGLLGPVHTKDFSWTFALPGTADGLSEKDSALVQQAVRAYAIARDSDEENGATLAEKLEKVKAKAVSSANFDYGYSSSGVEIALKGGSSAISEGLAVARGPAFSEHQLPKDVSSAWWEVCEDLEGPNFPVPGGFQVVAQHLARNIPILYNEKVTKIEFGENGVIVRTSKDHAYNADAVIFTASLGVLKEDHKSLFSPGLPAEKVKAIEGLGFGYNEKIFVEFENEACSTDPVSQVPCVAYHLLWDIPWPGPQKHQILHNGSAAAKESSVTAEGLPSWVPGMFSFRFGGSEFKPAQIPTHSQHEVEPFGEKYTSEPSQYFGNSSIEMAHIAAHGQITDNAQLPKASDHPKAACLWVSGWHAMACANASDEEIRQGIGQTLDQFPAIPFDSSQIRRIWRSRWSTNPLFRGAYSYVSSTSTPQDIEKLAAPIKDKEGNIRVLFAGEATTATNTASTHGAIMTGLREADRLASSWSGIVNGYH